MKSKGSEKGVLGMVSGALAGALLAVFLAIPAVTAGVATGAALSGCSTLKAGPRAQLFEAATAYEPIQVAIEGVVTSPTVGRDLKAALKAVDEQAMNALRAGRFALEEGREDDVMFYTALLRQALIQARGYIAESAEMENAGVATPEDLTGTR